MQKNENENILLNIIQHLNDKKIDYIVAGGVAVVLQGVERLTMDLDLAVDQSKENIQKFIDAMSELGLVPRLPVPAETLLDEDKKRVMVEEKNALVFTFIDPKVPLRQVDFFMAPGLSYDELLPEIEEFDLDGTKIKVVSKKKLVELKLNVDPMRDKDLFDIKELQRLINSEKNKK